MDTSMSVMKASPSAAMAQTTHAIIGRALIGAAFPRAFEATSTTVVGTDRSFCPEAPEPLPAKGRDRRRRSSTDGRLIGGTGRSQGRVHIKAVAALLGHSSIAITGDVYGHTSDSTARAAVEGLGCDNVVTTSASEPRVSGLYALFAERSRL
jgi:hypothetical protein